MVGTRQAQVPPFDPVQDSSTSLHGNIEFDIIGEPRRAGKEIKSIFLAGAVGNQGSLADQAEAATDPFLRARETHRTGSMNDLKLYCLGEWIRIPIKKTSLAPEGANTSHIFPFTTNVARRSDCCSCWFG